MYGPAIDKHQAAIKKTLSAIRAKIRKLERQGTLKAFIHFKKGTQKMYLLEPSDEKGHRQYHYIGADPEAQATAKGLIERHAQREDLLSSERQLKYVYEDLCREASGLMLRMKDLDKHSRECLEGNGQGLRIRPGSYHSHVSIQDDDPDDEE